MNFFQKHKSEFIVISGALLAGILSFYITLAVYPMLDNEDDFTNDMQVADTYDVDNSNEVMHNGVEVIIENEKPINNEEVVNDLVSDEQASKIKNGTEELSESIEEENKELSYDEVIAKINEEESEIFEDLFSASGENVSEILISNPEIAEKVSNILDEDEEADKVIETSAINSDVQNILVDDKATPKILKFEMPVSGEITLEFAKDKLVFSETLNEWITHDGIDIQADVAEPVKAVADGVVESTKMDPRYGNTIIISHANGYKTIYSNLSTLDLVYPGQNVNANDIISGVGEGFGFESKEGAHIHFEVLLNGEYKDPEMFF